MEKGDRIYFMAWYGPLGNLQTNGDKKGFYSKVAEVVKEDDQFIKFQIEGEGGIRKFEKSSINTFRDYGTSIVGLYDREVKEALALRLISYVLDVRINATHVLIADIKSQYTKLEKEGSKNGEVPRK